jgi:decaprenyl-phosphate phosphoribosyltransferase
MVSGKRYAESLSLGEDRGEHRATLEAYSPAFLRYVRSVSSSVAVTAYCLWAFEKAGTATCLVPPCPVIRSGHGALAFQLSAVPFALGILRYALLLDAGKGGAPEDVVLGDRTLQALGAVLVAVFAVGLYLN